MSAHRLVLILTLALALTMVACATAPKTPHPTPTPLGGIALADMEGWWTNSNSFLSTWHIAADGTGEMFYDDPHTRLWRPFSWLQFTPSAEGIELEDVRGNTGRGCSDKTGLYRISAEAPDSLRFEMIREPCDERQTWYKDALFTRASSLENLMGAWQSTSMDDCSLVVGEDLYYCLRRGQGSAAETVLEGTLRWDVAYKHIELQGLGTSPCGPTKRGKYKVALDDDGNVTLECVEDLCTERRNLIEKWCPLARDPKILELAGIYTAKEAGSYELVLRPGGTFRLRDTRMGEGWLLRQGHFSVDERTMLLVDRHGEARCPDEMGEYAFRLEEDALRLEVENDDCGSRSGFFGEYPDWERQ